MFNRSESHTFRQVPKECAIGAYDVMSWQNIERHGWCNTDCIFFVASKAWRVCSGWSRRFYCMITRLAIPVHRKTILLDPSRVARCARMLLGSSHRPCPPSSPDCAALGARCAGVRGGARAPAAPHRLKRRRLLGPVPPAGASAGGEQRARGLSSLPAAGAVVGEGRRRSRAGQRSEV